MNIYYLGPAGSYSHTLITRMYPSAKHIPCRSFSHIVENIEKDTVSLGLLGIENSTSSSVHESIDLLFARDLHIVEEAFMNIRLHLIGVTDAKVSDIHTVYSHPQALAQCSRYITDHSLQTVESLSTTAAVREVNTLQNPQIAAIAGRGAIAGSNLRILEEHIGNVSHNITRWVVISRTQNTISNPELNKLSVIFKVKHEPGSLVHVLQSIADHDGNLSKIESRPVAGSNWEYEFWVDIEVPEGRAALVVERLKQETLKCRIVGVYKKGQTYDE
ncbi:hypothetical protein KBD81_05325 [Candidatus Woesebacteria bacterium]|nr:hypothetical protein [Candidatus Woesebacteria bacterium]